MLIKQTSLLSMQMAEDILQILTCLNVLTCNDILRNIKYKIQNYNLQTYPTRDSSKYQKQNTKIQFADLPDKGFFKIENRKLEQIQFADLPDEGPVISGSQPRYHTGDILVANCSSSRSLPAASLK